MTIQEAVARATRKILPRCGSVRDINNGSCEDWANEVEALVPGAEAVWLDEFGGTEFGEEHDVPHCAVLYAGRWYDAEAPHGVDRPEDLPCCAEWLREGTHA